MNSIKRLTALLCAFACILSLTGLYTAADEKTLITPFEKTGLFVDRSGESAYLCGVPCDSTAESIKNLIEGECEVCSSTPFVKTGDKISLFVDGVFSDMVTIVVTGDINNDGTLNGKDAIRLKKLINTNITDPLQKRICDVNNDGKINNSDTSKLISMFSSHVDNISFIGSPEKTVYYEGEEFSSSGIYVNKTLADGTVFSYGDGFEIEYPAGNSYFKEYDNKVTLIYGDSSKVFDVKVVSVSHFEARITKKDSTLSVAFADTNLQLSDTSLMSSQIWEFTKQSDGSFEIKNKDTGKCIEVENGIGTSGTNVRVADDNDSKSQRWNIRRNESGNYTITSCLGAYAMDIFEGKVINGSNVQIYTPNGTDAQCFCIDLITETEEKIEAGNFADIGTDIIASLNNVSSNSNVSIMSNESDNVALNDFEKTSRQLWRFAKQSDGSYILINQENGKALAVEDADISNGANVTVKAQNAADNFQKWFIVQGSTGYALVSKSSAGRVLDTDKSNTENNINIQLGEYKNNFAEQHFTITKFTDNYVDYATAAYIGSHFNTEIIPSFASGKRLALSAENVILYGASECSDQVWRFEYQSDNTYKIVNNSNGKVLTVPNGDTTDGTALQVSDDNGSGAQRWYLLKKEDSFIIQSALSNKAVVDIYAASTDDGTKIDVYTPNLTNAQIFTISIDNITSMSYNVYTSKASSRAESVVSLIKSYMPDTLGVQEANPTWMTILKDGLGGTYDCVGEGRDGNGKGEHSAIFYNKHIFTLIDSGTKWLSDTPDTVSKFSDSLHNRVLTYALLQRKSNGEKVFVVNTHLDNSNNTVRQRQFDVINSFISAYKGKYPIVLTGDFNFTDASGAYKSVIDSGLLDTGKTAPTRYEGPTYTNFGKTSKIIDYVFITPDVNAKVYKACTEQIGGSYPSDHCPVLLKYSLK